eukprot:5797040-Amphidinium_carterae.1
MSKTKTGPHANNIETYKKGPSHVKLVPGCTRKDGGACLGDTGRRAARYRHRNIRRYKSTQIPNPTQEAQRG